MIADLNLFEASDLKALPVYVLVSKNKLTFGNYQSDRSNLHKSLLVLGSIWKTNVSSVYNLSSSLVSLSFQCTAVAVEDTPAPLLSSMRTSKCLMELLPVDISNKIET